MFRQKTMGFVVKITSFLYRYLNGRDEKIFVKKPRTRGDRVLEERVLGGDYCTAVYNYSDRCVCSLSNRFILYLLIAGNKIKLSFS